MAHNLLIVDDCGQNLKVLKEVFAEQKYNIYFANSADNALRTMSQTKIDLALLDVMMPGTNGIQLCSIMKQAPAMADIPVIFLSADQSTESKLQGFDSGCVDYISKPFVNSEVIARVKLHLSLIDAQEKLKTDAEFKMKMLSMASHELNNDLTRVTLGVDMCERSFIKENFEKHKDQLKALKRNARSMCQTLKEFIGIARNNVGELTPFLSLFDLQKVVDELIADYSECSSSARLLETIDIEDNHVISDRSLLIHIFQNLISNALKYSPDDQAVELTLHSNSDVIELSVKDYGIGVPEEEQSDIFASFNRASNVRDIKGTGIGLSLVKQFIEALEGEISLESRLGGPTVFSVQIPISVQKQRI